MFGASFNSGKPLPAGAILNGASTTTPLGVGGTYTSNVLRVGPHPSVVITVATDRDGTCYAEFSSDGANWDYSIPYEVHASQQNIYKVQVIADYFRTRVVNTSGVSQTYLRVQSLTSNGSLDVYPLKNIIPHNAPALPVTAFEMEFLAASGKLDGISIVNKFGMNTDIDTTPLPEDIWYGGGVYTGFPVSSLETVNVVSTSVNDTAAGSGARQLFLSGLDTNYNTISETVTLNGTTPVTSLNQYRRVNFAYVVASGSSNTAFNAGNITIRHTTTSANVFVAMQAGRGQSNTTAYTVPAGKTGYIRRLFCGLRGGTTATCEGSLWTRHFGFPPRLQRPFEFTAGDDMVDIIYGGIMLPEKTDLILRITACAANNTVVAGGYDLLLIDN